MASNSKRNTINQTKRFTGHTGAPLLLITVLVALACALGLAACAASGQAQQDASDASLQQDGASGSAVLPADVEADDRGVPSDSGATPQAAAAQGGSGVAAGAAGGAGTAGATTASADLAWRDTDFPVDPSKSAGSTKDNGRKVVYLTIDDGPSARTPEVLDILDKYNCKATFFVVGHNPEDYHYIKEAYDRGHTIGLHTFSHDYAEVYSSTDAFFADLDRIGQVVKDQIGYVPCFTRFPGGSSNGISASYAPGIMSVLVDEVQARGYQYYDWDASFGDGAEHTAEEMVGYVKEATLETNLVLLCHDSVSKQTTVEALPEVIEYFQGLGYTFEAIDRTTWTPHHAVGN